MQRCHNLDTEFPQHCYNVTLSRSVNVVNWHRRNFHFQGNDNVNTTNFPTLWKCCDNVFVFPGKVRAYMQEQIIHHSKNEYYSWFVNFLEMNILANILIFFKWIYYSVLKNHSGMDIMIDWNFLMDTDQRG